MDRKEVALLVLREIEGYDRIIVAPVLEDWVNDNPFRKQDRHRLLILSDHLAMPRARAKFAEKGVTELIEAVRGAL